MKLSKSIMDMFKVRMCVCFLYDTYVTDPIDRIKLYNHVRDFNLRLISNAMMYGPHRAKQLELKVSSYLVENECTRSDVDILMSILGYTAKQMVYSTNDYPGIETEIENYGLSLKDRYLLALEDLNFPSFAILSHFIESCLEEVYLEDDRGICKECFNYYTRMWGGNSDNLVESEYLSDGEETTVFESLHICPYIDDIVYVTFKGSLIMHDEGSRFLEVGRVLPSQVNTVPANMYAVIADNLSKGNCAGNWRTFPYGDERIVSVAEFKCGGFKSQKDGD